ncbi:hypothetical protein PFISCL1PPCAC_20849, partial [Pristionchus fissidentatus]
HQILHVIRPVNIFLLLFQLDFLRRRGTRLIERNSLVRKQFEGELSLGSERCWTFVVIINLINDASFSDCRTFNYQVLSRLDRIKSIHIDWKTLKKYVSLKNTDGNSSKRNAR